MKPLIEHYYLSKARIDDIKNQYKELYATLLKDNEEQTLRGGWISSLEQHAAFNVSIEAKRKMIDDLKRIIDRAKILPDYIGGNKIILGKWFILNIKGTEKRYRLVDPIEADPSKNLLSSESPLGSLVINKQVGEEIEIGIQTVKIVKIE